MQVTRDRGILMCMYLYAGSFLFRDRCFTVVLLTAIDLAFRYSWTNSRGSCRAYDGRNKDYKEGELLVQSSVKSSSKIYPYCYHHGAHFRRQCQQCERQPQHHQGISVPGKRPIMQIHTNQETTRSAPTSRKWLPIRRSNRPNRGSHAGTYHLTNPTTHPILTA